MAVQYAPASPAHPTRTGAHRTNRPTLLVVHTSEGGETSSSAEALARFIATPRTASNLASYHYITDTDSVIPVVPDDYIAYAAAGGNAQGLHICHPGRAAQSRDEWFDANSAGFLEQGARWLADKSQQYGIPLDLLGPSEVRAGASGVCGHFDVSQAFGRSTHTDPGKGYPWQWVMARARELATPLPQQPPPPIGDDDDMDILTRYSDGTIYVVKSGFDWRFRVSQQTHDQMLASGRYLVMSLLPEEIENIPGKDY